MLRKEKRSLSLCLVIGDGCLHYLSKKGSLSGGLTITHCIKQADLLAWKANLITQITGKSVKIRPHSHGRCFQFCCTWKRFRVWRDWFYPGNRKDRIKILRYIEHPQLMISIWFCDDGSSDKNGRLRLHTSSMTKEENEKLVLWLYKHFSVNPKINTEKQHKTGKSYHLLQFSSQDTIVMYLVIRNFVLQFKSMRQKFLRTEHRFQRISTEPPTSRYGKDIVRQST